MANQFSLLSKISYFRSLLTGSCGRVARQSSAKASTAVRIRSGPLLKGSHLCDPSQFYLSKRYYFDFQFFATWSECFVKYNVVYSTNGEGY